MNHTILKKLAKSNKHQMLYNYAKELHSLKLFSNNTDLSEVQLWVLYYLELYNSLYKDLASGENFISEEVIEDDLRAEAYILFRREKRKKKTPKNNKRRVSTSNDMPSVIFKEK